MITAQNNKFTAAECKRCGISEGKVDFKRIRKEISEHTTVVEEYIRCPACGNLIDYTIENHNNEN